MPLIITHAKTNTITDWTQAQLDSIIAGNAAPLPPVGTVLNDVVLPSDWNNDHQLAGSVEWGEITGTITDQTDLVNYIASVTGDYVLKAGDTMTGQLIIDNPGGDGLSVDGNALFSNDFSIRTDSGEETILSYGEVTGGNTATPFSIYDSRTSTGTGLAGTTLIISGISSARGVYKGIDQTLIIDNTGATSSGYGHLLEIAQGTTEAKGFGHASFIPGSTIGAAIYGSTSRDKATFLADVAAGTFTGWWAGYFDGDVNITGTLTVSGSGPYVLKAGDTMTGQLNLNQTSGTAVPLQYQDGGTAKWTAGYHQSSGDYRIGTTGLSAGVRFKIDTSGFVTIGTNDVVASTALTIGRSSSPDNIIGDQVSLARYCTSGTDTGFGAAYRFDMDNSVNTLVNAASWGAYWSDATDGSEDAVIYFATLGVGDLSPETVLELSRNGSTFYDDVAAIGSVTGDTIYGITSVSAPTVYADVVTGAPNLIVEALPTNARTARFGAYSSVGTFDTFVAALTSTSSTGTATHDLNTTVTIGGAYIYRVGGTDVAMADGGTGASLTPSNGGIVWTDAGSMEVLAGTGTAGRMLRSGASATPSWSTAVWPADCAQGDLIYASTISNYINLTGNISLTKMFLTQTGTGSARNSHAIRHLDFMSSPQKAHKRLSIRCFS